MVSFNWATYYQVFRHTSNDSASATSLSSSHPSSPYIDTSAVAGTTYYYWIKACNSGGCSSYSVSDSGYRAVENQAPVADAGEDQTVGTNAFVTLDGGGSFDPDGDLLLTFAWTKTGGLSVLLDDQTLEKPSFTAPNSIAILTFSLVVTDDKGTSSVEDEVVIHVIGYFLYLPLVTK